MTREQKTQLKDLIARADACASRASGEISKCLRGIKREIVYQLNERDIHKTEASRDKVIRAIQLEIARLRRRLERLEDAQAENSARTGYRAFRDAFGNITTPYSEERAEAVIAASRAIGRGGLAAVYTSQMESTITSALRAATLAAFNENAVAGGTMRELSQTIKSKWLAAVKDSGKLTFTDKRGRVWDTDTYLMMNVRTNSMRIYNDMMVDTIVQTTGRDLARISDGGGTADGCDACAEWAGRIVSISGGDEDFPSLEEARAAGVFHPNCTHTLEPLTQFDEEEIEKQRGRYV